MSSVYILVYPHLDAVKIGKANNVFNRTQQLCHWGKPDFDKSYVVHVDASDVYKLEGALHLKLSNYKKEMHKSDGYTEFFDLRALHEIDSILNYFGFKKSKISYQKEIINKKRRNNYKSRKFKIKIDRKINAVNFNIGLIENLKRFLIVLKKKGCICNFESKKLIVHSGVFRFIKNFSFGFKSYTGNSTSFFVCMVRNNTIYIDIELILSSINDYLNLGVSLYSDILIDCYNFLKKDLPNESELPSITINKENRLEIF